MSCNSKFLSSIRLLQSSPQPCIYKPGEHATSVFLDPYITITKRMSSKLSELGYRRSGAHLYRPDCQFCHACISCRIPVAQFRLSRSYKRVLSRNNDLTMVEQSNLADDNSYALYSKYISERHGDGDMFPATMEEFESFIKTRMVNTRFHLFYEQGNLVMVSVIDELDQGVSAVYTFYDTDLNNRSLGKYAILRQINYCQSRGLPYLFLGYWIRGCAKMHYKISFRPIELLLDDEWIVIN